MSDSFENVAIVKKANVYFGGDVVSRTVTFPDGSSKTLGFMQAGDYEFGTEAAELMEVLGGEGEVLLPGSDTWQAVAAGESFNVIGNSKFGIKVNGDGLDYCCTYLS
mgnify:CR=1 FL=1|jgi:purine/pyrimidine-nucleoside phosphorylase